MKYLVNNRKHATYWNSTRDTALVIEALADYIKASGEDKPDLTVEVWVDGQKRKEVKINAENLFTFDNAFVLEGDALDAGPAHGRAAQSGHRPAVLERLPHQLHARRRHPPRRPGAESRAALLQAHAGRQIDRSRRRPRPGRRAARRKVRPHGDCRTSAASPAATCSRSSSSIESKNDYEYILFEDMKAAGCEPVALQSGYNGNELGAYMELRDNRVALFVRSLARGRHSVSYRMRAEIPGRFSALPTKASAMYAPELSGNSDELKLRIEDASRGEASRRNSR